MMSISHGQLSLFDSLHYFVPSRLQLDTIEPTENDRILQWPSNIIGSVSASSSLAEYLACVDWRLRGMAERLGKVETIRKILGRGDSVSKSRQAVSGLDEFEKAERCE